MSSPIILPSYTKTWHSTEYPAISPTRPELSAKGKTIVVTGGGTGIGAQIALSFAQAGASSIGLIGRRQDKLQTSASAIKLSSPNANVSYAIADVLDVPALESAFKKLHTELGQIDILVSNAAYLDTPAKLVDSDPADWWRSFEVNIKGTYNSVRTWLPYATASKTLLAISTAAAHLPEMGNMSAYASAKLATAKVVEYVASEIKDLHVVNIHPGVVASEINSKSSIPPMDSVELPGNFCVWLASPEAKFLHGRFVWVNWDVDELKGRSEEIENNPHLLKLTLEGPVFA